LTETKRPGLGSAVFVFNLNLRPTSGTRLNGVCVQGLFSKLLNLPFRFPLLAGTAVLVLTFTTVPGPALAAESQRMPLAEKSLLLDGQVISDRIVVVGERGHILTSEDHGVSWQQQQVPTRATLTSVFFIDPANGWAAGHDSIILRTSDGGRHWQEIYSDPNDERPILDLWFRDMDHGYAVGAYGLFLTTEDGGEHWEPFDFNPATLIVDGTTEEDPWEGEEEEDVWVDFHLNQIATSQNGRVFIAAEAGNLYRSDDGCRSWLGLPSPYEGSFYGSLPLDQTNVLFFGLRGHLFRSQDAGGAWIEVDSGTQATLNDGIRLRDGRIALAGLAGVLLLSSDEGENFALYSQENRAGIAKILQADDGTLILLGDHGVKRLSLPGTGQEAGQ
jgi:photosystem II stability/assembly factor-like uncharacterized protein